MLRKLLAAMICLSVCAVLSIGTPGCKKPTTPVEDKDDHDHDKDKDKNGDEGEMKEKTPELKQPLPPDAKPDTKTPDLPPPDLKPAPKKDVDVKVPEPEPKKATEPAPKETPEPQPKKADDKKEATSLQIPAIYASRAAIRSEFYAIRNA